MRYQDLNFDEKWLREGDSPHQIGGRDLDIEQIADCLYKTVKEYFPINEVPEDIFAALLELKKTMGEAEASIQAVIELVSDAVHTLEE